MKKDLIVVYPVVLTFDDSDSSVYSYSVYIPAFDGYTEGENLTDAIFMARDYIGLMSVDYLDDGKALPETGTEPEAKAGETVTLVDVNVDAYRRQNDVLTDV